MSWYVLDLFFLLFHSTLILFNLLGWIIPRTRRLNLITLLLTGLSWTVPGICYGFGYCPLTDWHWQVLQQTGEPPVQISYVQYLLFRTVGLEMSAGTADLLTLIFFGISLLCSVYMNFFFSKMKIDKAQGIDSRDLPRQ